MNPIGEKCCHNGVSLLLGIMFGGCEMSSNSQIYSSQFCFFVVFFTRRKPLGASVANIWDIPEIPHLGYIGFFCSVSMTYNVLCLAIL